MTLTSDVQAPTFGLDQYDLSFRLAAGAPIVVSRSHDSDCVIVVAAAESVTTATAAFMIRHSSGFLQIALPHTSCQTLVLPPMNPFDTSRTRMCVGVDAITGTGTGISASDRATTARALMAPTAAPGDFTRPGHLVPVAVGPDDSSAPTTAAATALELILHAGLRPGAVFAELVAVSDPTRMLDPTESVGFARSHGLPLIIA
ncbi:3,4-dihydroxy-2-butanone-4-phosphate synthase [Rhodococcus sp. G-MC3]|uniref:3,4-dihydroxy-2-butanone-4-phosphate synthase n=1 Tax=Rhodococcus sp. G-MC3 TaxID=3046209 RepID=UPI0024B9E4B8|nr:3,4-dihydroxy-2-butanone-4-phosphate synthase [Rhodococcus sp. G-MC3]MDJ0396398.1 3,4-dihydroxy-2-butanone-4-phosphate synthase [Rhodococcus sp. G-MC3]